MTDSLSINQDVRISGPDQAAAHSECVVVADPQDPSRLLVASKYFPDAGTYRYHLDTWHTDASGAWSSAVIPPLPPPPAQGWVNCGDPALMCDLQTIKDGQLRTNVYLVGNPGFDAAGQNWSVCVYQSTDFGTTWNLLWQNDDPPSDKPACASDPSRGRLFVSWDSTHSAVFARSTDHGATWSGDGRGVALPGAGNYSSIVVRPDGTVHVVTAAEPEIRINTSTDGGVSFAAATVVATLPPGAFVNDGTGTPPNDVPFRTLSLPASCAVGDEGIVVAWMDGRGDGHLRIHYRWSLDGGATWQGDPSGNALATATGSPLSRWQDVQPQLAARPDGTVACTFYRYRRPLLSVGGVANSGVLDVMTSVATDIATGFTDFATLSTRPSDPSIGLVHGSPGGPFYGDYFGLTATDDGFQAVWTDTRDGKQDLYGASFVMADDGGGSHDGPPSHPLQACIELEQKMGKLEEEIFQLGTGSLYQKQRQQLLSQLAAVQATYQAKCGGPQKPFSPESEPFPTS